MSNMIHIFAVDFETYYDDNCNIKKLGLEGYLQDEKFDAYLVSIVGNNGFEWIGHPSEFDWSYLEGAQLVSHNAEFDESVFHRGVQKRVMAPYSYNRLDLHSQHVYIARAPKILKRSHVKGFRRKGFKESQI